MYPFSQPLQRLVLRAVLLRTPLLCRLIHPLSRQDLLSRLVLIMGNLLTGTSRPNLLWSHPYIHLHPFLLPRPKRQVSLHIGLPLRTNRLDRHSHLLPLRRTLLKRLRLLKRIHHHSIHLEGLVILLDRAGRRRMHGPSPILPHNFLILPVLQLEASISQRRRQVIRTSIRCLSRERHVHHITRNPCLLEKHLTERAQ